MIPEGVATDEERSEATPTLLKTPHPLLLLPRHLTFIQFVSGIFYYPHSSPVTAPHPGVTN
ncbi:hypothetical protein E2C01_048896 [Portunus trituberculatus]|uniref:Uncharacterized protein n=1 Tax=Portunus trituberculatus TaxID=210409 RepID=A0A5B7GBR2_PORTR|nr:hypothetical protein [Portunus trituberculatus]